MCKCSFLKTRVKLLEIRDMNYASILAQAECSADEDHSVKRCDYNLILIHCQRLLSFSKMWIFSDQFCFLKRVKGL